MIFLILFIFFFLGGSPLIYSPAPRGNCTNCCPIREPRDIKFLLYTRYVLHIKYMTDICKFCNYVKTLRAEYCSRDHHQLRDWKNKWRNLQNAKKINTICYSHKYFACSYAKTKVQLGSKTKVLFLELTYRPRTSAQIVVSEVVSAKS